MPKRVIPISFNASGGACQIDNDNKLLRIPDHMRDVLLGAEKPSN